VTQPAALRAVEALIDHAYELTRAGRYGPALAAAVRAVEAAERLDDPALLVQALVQEAYTLRRRGEDGAALSRYTRILAIAEDIGNPGRLDQPDVVRAVAKGYTGWVECALRVGGMRVRELFGVLDAGERYLRSAGRSSWRAGLLLQRAAVHDWLGEYAVAVAVGWEALAAYQPGGLSLLSTHRIFLGDYLRRAGRADEAEPLYQAVLDAPGTTPVDRKDALVGLARCALDRGDIPAGRRHATAAVREAEPLGDSELSRALEALIRACLDASDLDTAAATAARKMEVARRLGGRRDLYRAAQWAVEVAADRGEFDTVAELLNELDGHAAALDADTGTSTEVEWVASWRRWLGDI
jgi:tetratricopeptide (TPR) repeat protein